jgi:hypothetical protein
MWSQRNYSHTLWRLPINSIAYYLWNRQWISKVLCICWWTVNLFSSSFKEPSISLLWIWQPLVLGSYFFYLSCQIMFKERLLEITSWELFDTWSPGHRRSTSLWLYRLSSNDYLVTSPWLWDGQTLLLEQHYSCKLLAISAYRISKTRILLFLFHNQNDSSWEIL